jgi:hypothetical protein
VDEHTLLRWSLTPSILWPTLVVFLLGIAALIVLLRGITPVRAVAEAPESARSA